MADGHGKKGPDAAGCTSLLAAALCLATVCAVSICVLT